MHLEKSRNILQAVNQVSIWDTLILLYSSLLLGTPQLSTLPKLFSMKTCCFISERDSTLALGYPMGIGTRTSQWIPLSKDAKVPYIQWRSICI